MSARGRKAQEHPLAKSNRQTITGARSPRQSINAN